MQQKVNLIFEHGRLFYVTRFPTIFGTNYLLYTDAILNLKTMRKNIKDVKRVVLSMESDEYQDQGWTEHMTKNRKRNLEKKKLMKKVEELQNEVKYLDRSGSANVNENDDALKQMNNDTDFIEQDADTNRRPRSFKP
ncbi:hypothetical protein AM593_01094, partial [Mytilus galloprovincialis]